MPLPTPIPTLAKTDPVVAVGVVVGFIALAVTIGALTSLAAKKRRAKIALLLDARGYSTAPEPKDPAHAVAFAASGMFQSLKRGATGVRWSAYREAPGVTLLEHYYTTGGGKNTQHHYHTIAAVPCPPAWPSLSIEPAGLLGKIAELFGSRDIKVEDEAFNKRFRVKGDSEDFALLVLPPQVQRWFMTLPDGLGVRIGAGAIAVFKRRAMKPEELPALGELPLALAALVPPELAAYGA